MTLPAWPVAVPSGQENAVLSRVARDSHSMLTNGLKIADNMFASIVTFPLVHNVEFAIPQGIMRNNSRPLFFQPMYSTKNETTREPGLGVQSVDPLNYSRADGKVGLKVRFAPPANMLGVTKNATQTGIANNSSTDVTWQTTEYIEGTFAYTGAGIFTIPASGVLRVAYDVVWSGNGVAAGDSVGSFFSNTTTSKRHAQTRFGVPTQSNPRMSAADEFPVTAGDTWALQVLQHNAAAAAKTIDWNATTSNTRLGLSYVAPPIGYSAWVTGILWGG